MSVFLGFINGQQSMISTGHLQSFWSRFSDKMSKQAVLTDDAPKPLPGIYSQAIVANGFVFCSGQVPMDPKTMKLAEGDIQAHTVG
jgi:hypothetical protein